jgi:hypothetical protein
MDPHGHIIDFLYWLLVDMGLKKVVCRCGGMLRLHEMPIFSGSFLDEREVDDGEDPGCRTLSVCSRVKTEDLAVGAEGKFCISQRL